MQTSNYSPEFGSEGRRPDQRRHQVRHERFPWHALGIHPQQRSGCQQLLQQPDRCSDRRVSSQSVRRRGRRSGAAAEIQRAQSHVHLWRVRRDAHREGHHAAHHRAHAGAAWAAISARRWSPIRLPARRSPTTRSRRTGSTPSPTPSCRSGCRCPTLRAGVSNWISTSPQTLGAEAIQLAHRPPHFRQGQSLRPLSFRRQ